MAPFDRPHIIIYISFPLLFLQFPRYYHFISRNLKTSCDEEYVPFSGNLSCWQVATVTTLVCALLSMAGGAVAWAGYFCG